MEPFKNVFNPTMIVLMAGHLADANRAFKKGVFVETASSGIERLELKARADQITDALERALPKKFESACALIIGALHPDVTTINGSRDTDDHGIRGWAIMPLAEYVARHGQAASDLDLALDTLRELTKRFTAEFAIRPFFAATPQTALAHCERWTADPNPHVRRLASEGTRPRLPWGIRLTAFDKDPTPILPILEALRDDPEEYVRRSVANNLNDISKSHPDLIAKIAKRWLKNTTIQRQRLIRHACRSLIKAGHPATLAAFGYTKPKIQISALTLDCQTVSIGETLEITTTLISESARPQPLVIDYIIHHRKANGTTSPKVFKWKTTTLPGDGRLPITKKHPFKPITTRRYYPGTHKIEIQVNGQPLASAEFELTTTKSKK